LSQTKAPTSITFTKEIPRTGTRTTLCRSISAFLKNNSSLHLGGDEDFHAERRKHLEVFGIRSIPTGNSTLSALSSSLQFAAAWHDSDARVVPKEW
jgi:hypothetical protein